MTSKDTNKQIAQAMLQPYLQEIASWTQQNQLHLNPDKTTSTLFTPDPAEYSTQLTLNIDNVVIPTVKNPKILGLTFDPKLTYNSHIRKTSDKARNTLKLLKALTSTKWGETKRNNCRNLQSHYQTYSRICLNNLVTNRQHNRNH